MPKLIAQCSNARCRAIFPRGTNYMHCLICGGLVEHVRKSCSWLDADHVKHIERFVQSPNSIPATNWGKR